MIVHQLLEQDLPGDASSAVAAALRQKLNAQVFFADAPPPRADVLVAHVRGTDRTLPALLLERDERIVLVCHDAGGCGLAQLQGRVAAVVAGTRADAAALAAAGFDDVRVVGPLVPPGFLVATEPHPPTAHHLETQVEGPVLLHVGWLDPEARLDLLLQAYHLLITHLDPTPHLVVAGPAPDLRYVALVRQYGAELNLQRLWFAGPRPVPELAAFYRRADAFVGASRQTGAQAGALAASRAGLPVVGVGWGSLPETVGGAGLLLPPEGGPALLAEAMADVVADPTLRSGLTGAAVVESGLDDLVAVVEQVA